MTADDCHTLIDNYYADPVFVEWQPSEYDMKYKYNTPRRMKKIPKDKAKEDAKLLDEFNKLKHKKDQVHVVISRVAAYPTEVSSLFLSTFKWTIENIVRRHEAYLNAKKMMDEKHGDIWSKSYSYVYDALRRSANRHSCYSMSSSSHTFVVPDEDGWKKAVESYRGDFVKDSNGEYGYSYPLKSISDWKTFCEDMINLIHAKENDDLCGYGKNAYSAAICHMADVLVRVMDEIEEAFDGEEPEECETGAEWGKDMHFDGILKSGDKRVSFKSFGAGGYNIQRFHYRFKCTRLKH